MAERYFKLLRPAPWTERAACKGKTEVFYPERGDHLTTERALEICAGCPVRAECREYALTECETFGIWGGMSQRTAKAERRKVDRQPRPFRHGVPSGYAAHVAEDTEPCHWCRQAHNDAVAGRKAS